VRCIRKAEAQFVCICTAVTTPFLVLWILGQKVFYFILLNSSEQRNACGKSKDFYNRSKKDTSYQQLITKVKEVKTGATQDTFMKKKINSLYIVFRKEQKGVLKSKESDANADEIYISILWYYNQLLL
jgi:hypothetical protein